MKNITTRQKLRKGFHLKDFFKGLLILISLIVFSFLIETVTFSFSSAPLNIALFKSYFRGPLLLLMNFIPIFIMMSFIYLISNRIWVGFSVTCLIFFAMSLVNKFKLMYRDDPFVFADLRLVKESMIMAKQYNLSLSYRTIALMLALVFIAFFLKIIFRNLGKKLDALSGKIRICLLLALALGSFYIFKNLYFDPSIYSKVGDKSLINIWIQSQQFQSRGFVYPFLYSIKDAKEHKPDGYDEEKAKKDLFTYGYDHIPEDEKVNIISIMLEAYNDFSEFDGVELGIDVYENFHNIQQESISGKLITNIFAGGTVNTERAFLTGYQSHPKYYSYTNSFVWYLRNQGYRTEAMHPITGSFYNRRNINEYLGFQSFDHYDNKYSQIQAAYLPDNEFFDYIIEGYKNSVKENQPYFNFTVTYQNHGPYSTEKFSDNQFLKKKDHYDEANYNIVNNYLGGISSTDRALKKLIDFFRNEEEPVILVIFGDHNPWLGENNSVYNMLKINLDLSTLDGFKNYYQTPYIIWANNKAKETFNKDFIGKGKDISPCFLMAELFEYTGWQGNEYMKYISDLKENIDLIHSLYFKENGEFKKELSVEGKKLIKDFINVEYYYSHNFMNK
ncbi:MAG: sulfatase-like hydrolase/transferase [Clostridiaceae bacterium]|nr:sulfatase-like hydrolase/transferase [Clostridiaceae bacterium]